MHRSTADDKARLTNHHSKLVCEEAYGALRTTGHQDRLAPKQVFERDRTEREGLTGARRANENRKVALGGRLERSELCGAEIQGYGLGADLSSVLPLVPRRISRGGERASIASSCASSWRTLRSIADESTAHTSPPGMQRSPDRELAAINLCSPGTRGYSRSSAQLTEGRSSLRR